MARPRGGDWLSDEVTSWRTVGINLVVSLLTDDEISELDLFRESEVCNSFGIGFQRFPIEDRGVPSTRDATIRFINDLWTRLDEGNRVAIHCRIGIGRSAMIAACLLRRAGHSVDSAFKLIEQARGVAVPDTEEQRNWVAALEFEC